MHNTTLAGLVAGLLVSGHAFAQLAPPPPEPPAPKPEYVRPPTPTPVPVENRRPIKPDISGIEFESLVKRDDRGRIMPLDLPEELAALNNNPLIGPEQREKIEPWLEQRRREMEKLVIEHVDVAIEVDNGIMNDLYVGDELALEALMELFRPLLIMNSVGTDMKVEKLLSAEQAALNDEIVRSYQTAKLEELRDTFVPGLEDETTLTDVILRDIFTRQMGEPMNAYYGLLVESAPRTADVIGGIAIDTQTAEQVKQIMAGHDPSMSREETIALMRRAIDAMEMAEARDLLQSTVDARE